MSVKYNEIQELLRKRTNLHAGLNLIPYDGTPEIKKYLVLNKVSCDI